MDVFLVTLLNGISLGGVLFLVASGLSLVLGVMGIANLAHGALYMIGAYLGWTIVAQHGGNFWLAAVAAAATAGLVGLVIERGFLRHLHGLFNEQVLLTIGFVYIITNLCLWIWGSIPKSPYYRSISLRFFPRCRLAISYQPGCDYTYRPSISCGSMVVAGQDTGWCHCSGRNG